MNTWIIRSLPLLLAVGGTLTYRLAGPAKGVLPLEPLFNLKLTAETVAYGLRRGYLSPPKPDHPLLTN